MKDLSGIIWITQLGMSVCAPMAGFALLGVWLKNVLHAGAWLVALFCVLGLIAAADSFRITLKVLEEREKRRDKGAFPQNHNDHK